MQLFKKIAKAEHNTKARLEGNEGICHVLYEQEKRWAQTEICREREREYQGIKKYFLVSEK